MREEDLSIYEYRMKKEIQNGEAVLYERLNGNFEKISIRTDTSGYVDASIYRPKDRENKILPAIFNFHGGGNVLGYYELDGRYCQYLADETGYAIINVDYCLAPEFKFPKPIDSTYEFLTGIKKDASKYGLDMSRTVLCGHSAGGYMAAAICLLNKERAQLDIAGQILDYAPLKQTLSKAERLGKGLKQTLSQDRMMQYVHWYFDDLNEIDNPLASPALGDLHDLPKMLVIGAEYDPLLEEEKNFARKAREAGGDVKLEIFEGCHHGFTHSNLKEYNQKQADKAWKMMADFISACIGKEAEA